MESGKMNQTIWKKVLEAGLDKFNVPAGSSIISTATQGNDIVVWYLVRDPNAPMVPVIVTSIPTGALYPDIDSQMFIGTAQLPGDMVFHIFAKYMSGFADRA
jgi:hypothetical protein